MTAQNKQPQVLRLRGSRWDREPLRSGWQSFGGSAKEQTTTKYRDSGCARMTTRGGCAGMTSRGGCARMTTRGCCAGMTTHGGGGVGG